MAEDISVQYLEEAELGFETADDLADWLSISCNLSAAGQLGSNRSCWQIPKVTVSGGFAFCCKYTLFSVCYGS